MSNRLRVLRKEKHLTLRELSEIVNISFSNIAMLERGERNFTADTVKSFAEFFNVSSDYLLGLSDIRNAQITTQTINVDSVDVEILNEVKELQNKDKEDLLKIIKFMKIKGEL
jgi:transcriptional regulator with XRE-family HTH domain